MISALIARYLAVRRATGFDLEGAESLLRNFAKFAAARSLTHIQTQAACQWAQSAPSPEQRDRRLSTVRRLAQFAAAEDGRHQVPPAGFFGGKRRRRPPRIYTAQEIASLLRAALHLGPPGTLWPRAFRTLLALLVATGLRISEAVGLRFGDLTDEGLLVRKSKFRKSRLLPLHPSTRKALEDYLGERRRQGGLDDHLFLSRRGRPLSRKTAGKVFRGLVEHVGLSQVGSPRPCLHAFRHTFATRALERCPEGRDQVGRHLLALSTYLGHARIADTYWYLESTPTLMKDIGRALDRFVRGGGR